jgi:tRNA modification GTPase
LHGSNVLVEGVVEAFLSVGARKAEQGEFTRRALANGKMDLVQAEGVRDLIAAESRRQLDNARRQQKGELSEHFSKIREHLLGLWATLEAGLEFAAQGVVVDSGAQEESRQQLLVAIDGLLAGARTGKRLREGASVVIIGPPNAGKSTLFNTLLGEERAIVNPSPGTTRDAVEARLEIDGLIVSLFDTAGVRATQDEIELAGVVRTVSFVEQADLVLDLVPSDEVPREETTVDTRESPTIKIQSKADLCNKGRSGDGERLLVSAVTGRGMAELRAQIREQLGGAFDETKVAIAGRHQECLEQARRSITDADLNEPELAAEDLRIAAQALAELLGEVADEDVLDRVFSGFCVGK